MNIHDNDGDFSNKDIRGKKFSEEYGGKNKKFRYSKAGIKSIYRYSLVLVFCLLLILISVALAIALLPGISEYKVGKFNSQSASIAIALSMLGIFLFSITRQGFTGALLASGTVSVIGLILLVPLLIGKERVIVHAVFSGMYIMVIAFGGIVMFAFSITVLSVLSNRWVKYAAMSMAISVMVASIPNIFRDNNEPLDYLIDYVLNGIILIIGFCISTRSLYRDPRFDSIRLAAISFCSRCYSTSFRGVNLTNADFSGAVLRNVDFRKANLTMTRFSNTKNIEYACLDDTHFLQNLKAQQLAITLDVNELSDKNFNYLNLEGINLENSKLRGASFIGANLKNANLSGADLSGANLKQAQLVGADLTGATLTGACIEDWGITKGTELKEVKCEFIFLECKEEYDRNGYSLIKFQKQYPNDRKFKDGEFTKRSYLAWEKYEENKTTTINFNAPVTNVILENEGGIHNL